MFAGGIDKGEEERVRPIWATLELWVELAAHHKRMVAHLRDLDEPAIRRQPQSGADQ